MSLHQSSALGDMLPAGLELVFRRALWPSQPPLLVYVVSVLTVLAASPDVNFTGRIGVIPFALLLVLSAERSGERNEVEDLCPDR